MRVVGKEIRYYQATCSLCNSILSFTDDDIKKGFINILDRVKCPICGKQLFLGRKEKFLSSTEIGKVNGNN